jgi:hypothetical protein
MHDGGAPHQARHWLDDGVARWRRARRPWRCRGATWWDARTALPVQHTATIQPGSLCLEWLADSPPFQSGPRLCVACAVAVGFPPPAL